MKDPPEIDCENFYSQSEETQQLLATFEYDSSFRANYLNRDFKIDSSMSKRVSKKGWLSCFCSNHNSKEESLQFISATG